MQYCHHSSFTDKEAETAEFSNVSAIMHVGSGGIVSNVNSLVPGHSDLKNISRCNCLGMIRLGQGKKQFEVFLYI